MALPPFLIEMAFREGEQERDRIAQFETIHGQMVKYLFDTHHDYAQDPEFSKALARLRAAARDCLPSRSSVTDDAAADGGAVQSWEVIRALAFDQAKRTTERQVGHENYLKARYVNREEVEARVDDFLADRTRLLAVVGSSGTGKTNLMCWLTGAVRAGVRQPRRAPLLRTGVRRRSAGRAAGG